MSAYQKHRKISRFSIVLTYNEFRTIERMKRMEQLIILVRERAWEQKSWRDMFLVKQNENPEQSFRNAIADYLASEVGKNAIKETSEDFNWGDAFMYIPTEIWKKHGITPINEGDQVTVQNPLTIAVDQDEVLIPAAYYE